MAETWDLFMGTVSSKSGPSERLGAYLRRKFPATDGYSIKRLSRAIDCTEKAADNLLRDKWPCARHWQRIAILYGTDVLDCVFGPDIDATITRLKREEAELAELLEQKRARRLQAQGFVDRAPQHAEASEALGPNVESFHPRASDGGRG